MAPYHPSWRRALNLGDVLKELGDTPLKGHVWAGAIVTTLNAILPSSQKLTEDSTGRQVLSAMVLLPEPDHSQLLASQVDLIKGTLTLATSSAAPTQAAAGNGKASSDPQSDTFHRIIVSDLTRKPSRTIALMVGLALAICAILVAVMMTYSYGKTGKTPDHGLFDLFVHALGELLKGLSSN